MSFIENKNLYKDLIYCSDWQDGWQDNPSQQCGQEGYTLKIRIHSIIFAKDKVKTILVLSLDFLFCFSD